MVDYSKWKDIEVGSKIIVIICLRVRLCKCYCYYCLFLTPFHPLFQISDDEDETHPNIDTPSLFRWRHQARVDRMEERKREKGEHEQRKAENLRRLVETRKKLDEAEPNSPNLDSLKKELEDLENQQKQIQKRDEELKKKEKLTPWNVDTISEPGFTKTIINSKPARKSDENMTEEEKEAKMKKFIKENESLLKQFGMLRRYDDSKKFLLDHNHLACEETANYLVIWCINLEMEEVCILFKSKNCGLLFSHVEIITGLFIDFRNMT